LALALGLVTRVLAETALYIAAELGLDDLGA